ncbi:telomeric repeat-binding factor 2-interacting protein 1-like [Tubulanus polymorphus]|uniref:telomeric repeat-binding factor 2-interacting protein 1-like n=1 Tax=Tubulanus polymorphus TaxID=672921 RepID=UPI003DA22E69
MSSSQIFVDENGDALTFYIRPSKEKRRIRSLIVKNGGQLISNPGVDEGCIRLIEEGTLVIQKGNILSRFIDDCLKADRLLDKERYLIKDFGVARLHSVEDDDHGVSNSILTSTKEKVTLMAKCSGRKKYTYQEDMDIIRYLIKNKRYRDTKGNSVWKEMEEEQVQDGHYGGICMN